MKKNYFIALLALVVNFASAQIEQTTYRGAFAPSPTAMWTDLWTNYDPQNEEYPDAATVVNVTANISASTTWTTGKTYKLTGLIYVTNNAILTIQPGVIIKGVYTNTGTALIITKGAKLNAIGTASAPIVFTSAKPATQRAAGDWGGIVLLGKAGFNLNGGVNNIEGITATVNTQYGGGTSPIADDNSGTMKYCRIEFPGFVFSPNNEINGLTLGAVGSGTTIDYVQVSYCGDDSFEWFGGSVNCKHLVAYRGLDDDFDTDNGYNGTVQFALGIRDPNIADNPTVSTSEGFESDNNADTAEAASGYNNTTGVFSNCTMIGPSKRQATVASGYARALRLRRTTELKVYNSIFLDFKNNYVGVTDNQTIGKYNVNKVKIKSNIFAGFYGSDLTDYPNGVNPKTLTGTSTTAAYAGGAIPNGTVFNLGTKMSGDGNTTVSSSNDILVSPYDTSNYTVYTGRDYRPGTAALTGANFSDFSIVGEAPTVTNRVYCKGDVATALSATLTGTGASLKWYNAVVNTTTLVVSVGTLITTGAPTPVTTTAGVKYYYVSQVDAAGLNESAKVQVSVTVNATPTDVLVVITGTDPAGLTTAAALTAVGKYVGTSSTFTYTTSGAVAPNTYFWSVPNGVNILAPTYDTSTPPVQITGQGTNTITVNYLNVPYGAGAVGTLSVQAINANGCKSAAKTLAITKALPTAPATLLLTNKNLTGTAATTSITNYGPYMGQSTNLTLTAGTSATASSYQWQLPAGVNLVIPSGTTPVTTTAIYTAEPFLSTSSIPTVVSNKYWTVTSNKYTYNVNGVSTTTTVSTATQSILGSERTYTFTIAANAIGANAVGTLFTYNGDTYKLKTATTSSSTSVVCNASAAPQPAGNYPSVVTTTIAGTLTNASVGTNNGATTAFSKIVKAGYDATVSQTYAPYGTVISSDLPAILVDFAGVTNSATTKLYLGVKAYNAVGSSVTSNATNTDVVANNTSIPGLFNATYTETTTPASSTSLTNVTSTYAATGFTASTAKLLTLTATIPAAPAAVTLTNPALSGTAATTAITIISKYLGTETSLRLTATASPLASSYVWELPTWVNVVSGATTSEGVTSGTSNVITVNFAGNSTTPAPAGVTSYYFGAKAKNGVGSSVTNNNALVPSANGSTAKLLKVTTSLPTAVATVTGQILSLCGGPYSYTMTASALANSYVITAPTNAVVTSASNSSNNSNVLTTSDLTFSVTYPAGFTVTTTTAAGDKSLVITSVNTVGNSATNKTLALTTALGAVGTNTNSYVNPNTGLAGVTLFGKCAIQTIAVPAVPFATSYVWTLPNGATGTSDTRTIDVNFAAVATTSTTKVTVKVKAFNGCVYSAEKSIILSFDGITLCPDVRMASNLVSLDASQIYPNPTSDNFNINLTSSINSEVLVTIYSMNGSVVKTNKIELNQGLNTINEDITSLGSGIYFVRLVNESNNETIVRKLIKR
jgi:hypothetical protein